MTQMLLFDSVAETTATPIVPVVNVPVAQPAAEPVSTSAIAQVSAKRSGEKREEGGLNHMGDLARLVLLRYDLVAKRREQMAARRRAR
ncbi:hypothetical protein Poly51_09790 [Rubripirellula tenax]|uniref:Uncharacterized protein n=1 Tax=Rubripirellula tenax TaxID=2528015 RepID=A0A5C6FGY5_9BACT|nr:hypothetical protein [Rubripirellula tenax]TWU60698.1 hypothetical protein Poly51_09790 [Rubripirellula tenax]